MLLLVYHVIPLTIFDKSYYITLRDIPQATTAVLSASALLLYQITSDFSEYWVMSRNQERADVNLDEQNGAVVTD